MARKKPPCIRDLNCFKKSGCPQKSWDGEEGCTAWIENTVSKRDNPLVPEVRKMCIDMWQYDLSYSILASLEGNQQAIESFRNGMVDIDQNNNTRPKPDPATVDLVNLMNRQLQKQKVIKEYENEKITEG